MIAPPSFDNILYFQNWGGEESPDFIKEWLLTTTGSNPTESATETILPGACMQEPDKGEKRVGVFCSRDKRLQLSPSGDGVRAVNPI